MHLTNPEGRNQSAPEAFILLDFNTEDPQILLFILFLAVYLVTMAGNILIIILVAFDPHLHTPMYFFLGNLSCLETCYSSTILPRMLFAFLSEERTISVGACLAQLYLFGFFAATECYFLAVMSYDRYLAICKPLHYVLLMNGRTCILLIAVSWIGGSLGISILIFLVSRLTFCGPNKINHFFCDFTPVVMLSCTDTHLVEMTSFIISSIGTLPPLLITLASYVCIINSILQIPCATGKQKAFSTCSSHLTVVSCFYGSLMIVYVLPDSSSLSEMKKLFSLFYTLLTPLLNPLIYSLRNKEVKEAVRNSFRKFHRLKIQKTRSFETDCFKTVDYEYACLKYIVLMCHGSRTL
ncbi:olfactory receptor 6N1-like [Sphaerodactylus townsendi]|uniref:olfactory receptor 6N1-like n=1 Tax=Sphaerodactylus townsendi TaxID=933632 RepID=UPI002025FAD1|nr:olfactory receptor 6N1-like [Sphaerodactylus townsendi]